MSVEAITVDIYRDGVNGYEVVVYGGTDRRIAVWLHEVDQQDPKEQESRVLFEREAEGES